MECLFADPPRLISALHELKIFAFFLALQKIDQFHKSISRSPKMKKIRPDRTSPNNHEFEWTAPHFLCCSTSSDCSQLIKHT